MNSSNNTWRNVGVVGGGLFGEEALRVKCAGARDGDTNFKCHATDYMELTAARKMYGGPGIPAVMWCQHCLLFTVLDLVLWKELSPYVFMH